MEEGNFPSQTRMLMPLLPFCVKVVVCIVADGRRKVHPRVLDCLTLLGVYQPGGHMRNVINHKPVTAHLFEYTTSFAIDPNLRFVYPDKGIVPTQIIFCMKEKNQKKINSHRWFFNAFAPLLQVSLEVLTTFTGRTLQLLPAKHLNTHRCGDKTVNEESILP